MVRTSTVLFVSSESKSFWIASTSEVAAAAPLPPNVSKTVSNASQVYNARISSIIQKNGVEHICQDICSLSVVQLLAISLPSVQFSFDCPAKHGSGFGFCTARSVLPLGKPRMVCTDCTAIAGQTPLQFR